MTHRCDVVVLGSQHCGDPAFASARANWLLAAIRCGDSTGVSASAIVTMRYKAAAMFTVAIPCIQRSPRQHASPYPML